MKKILFILVSLSIFLVSCEDVIDIELEQGTPFLVVDAFLNDKAQNQKVRITQSAPYFENVPAKGMTGATVNVSDGLGRSFNFVDQGNGDYVLPINAADSLPFAIVGNYYKLEIKYNGETYSSEALLNRTAPIDSIFATFQTNSFAGPDDAKDGYAIDLKSIDPLGEGDTYWFKVYRNDTLLNRPSNIVLAFDAAFGPGSDNIQFIPPIIFGLTPRLYQKGEKAKVEIHSISPLTYQWLFEAQSQMTNGGLFATPPYNIKTNIKNSTTDKTKQAIGWFDISSVSTAEIVF
ncbi:MAG: DUF4249 domain-containing protein [Bacteroidota bacterium]